MLTLYRPLGEFRPPSAGTRHDVVLRGADVMISKWRPFWISRFPQTSETGQI